MLKNFKFALKAKYIDHIDNVLFVVIPDHEKDENECYNRSKRIMHSFGIEAPCLLVPYHIFEVDTLNEPSNVSEIGLSGFVPEYKLSEKQDELTQYISDKMSSLDIDKFIFIKSYNTPDVYMRYLRVWTELKPYMKDVHTDVYSVGWDEDSNKNKCKTIVSILTGNKNV